MSNMEIDDAYAVLMLDGQEEGERVPGILSVMIDDGSVAMSFTPADGVEQTVFTTPHRGFGRVVVKALDEVAFTITPPGTTLLRKRNTITVRW